MFPLAKTVIGLYHEPVTLVDRNLLSTA